MTPIAIVEGTLMGKTLYKNARYTTKTAVNLDFLQIKECFLF